MASWRRQEHNDCCRGRRVNATPGRCCRVSACCIADDEQDALTQLAAVLAVGSQVLWPDDALHRQLVKALPSAVSERIQLAKAENITAQPFDAVIFPR